MSNHKWFDANSIASAEAVAPSAIEAQQPSGWSIGQIREFVFKHGDPSAPESEWYRWIRMIRLETGGSPEGLQLAIEWSRRGSNFGGVEPIEAKWNSPSWNDPATPSITIGTLRREYASTAATDDFEPITTDPGTPPAPLPNRDALDAPGLPTVVIRELGSDWHTRPIPKQSFVVEILLPRGKVTLLISAGGMGKTYIVLYLAICIALGLDFFGYRCEPGRVVILSGEDSFDTLHYRLRALSRQMPKLQFDQGAMGQIGQRIQFVDVEAMRKQSSGSLALTKSNGGGSASVSPFAKHLGDAIGQADLVIVDTASRFNGGEENSNGDAARLIEALEIIAEITGAAVFMLAHTGKAQGEGQYAARGASAFSDNARSVLVLSPLDQKLTPHLANPGQAKRAARNDILRLCHTKSNYAARADDMYFERHDSGALLPTQLTFALPADVDLVAYMLEIIGPSEVTRNKVKDEYKAFFPAGVKRPTAMQVFDNAVREGRLQQSGTSLNGKSTRYRVKQQPTAPVNGDLL